MPTTTLTYLEPDADERTFNHFHIKRMRVSGLVTFEGSFVVINDKKNSVKKYYPHNRIIQIDQVYNHEESSDAHAHHRNKARTEVFYLKVDIEEDDYVAKIRNVGSKPFGFECILVDKKQYFWQVLTPSFAALITIPVCRIIGGDVHYG